MSASNLDKNLTSRLGNLTKRERKAKQADLTRREEKDREKTDKTERLIIGLPKKKSSALFANWSQRGMQRR